MTELLVIGGPHSGTYVEDVGPIWQVMVVVQQGMASAAVPTKYIRRYLDGNFEDVGRLRKGAYVHESIPGPMEMAQLLANVLIGLWIQDGGEHVEDEEAGSPQVVPGGDTGAAAGVGEEPPRAASGLYLP